MDMRTAKALRNLEDLATNVTFRLTLDDGTARVADQLADLLTTFIPPAEHDELLPGNFSFRHDGAGVYWLGHGSNGTCTCSYMLTRDVKTAADLEQFEFALNQGLLELLCSEFAPAH